MRADLWTPDTGIDRAATADLKICVLSLETLFPPETEEPAALPSSSPAHAPLAPVLAPIDALTLSLIDRTTLILLNKTDAFAPSAAHLAALRDALRAAGKEWAGCLADPRAEGDGGREDRPFWLVSIQGGEGLAELARGLKHQVQRR